jgi:hypothetical protein
MAELTALDRCDAKDCPARGQFRFVFIDGNALVFCGHHGAKYQETAQGQGAWIDDQRECQQYEV